MTISNLELRKRLRIPAPDLLSECRMDTFRASGRGGQKKNKTSSAVRLTHKRSELSVTATRSRSQHDNKMRAVRKLRMLIALNTRLTAPEKSDLVWPESVQLTNGRLSVGSSNSSLAEVVAMVLDVIECHDGRISDAAKHMSVTSSSLVKFIHANHSVWEYVGQLRRKNSLSSLKKP
jgi:hypothetical protein